MHKIAIVLFAFVSMAMASCGGGQGNIKPASPAIIYEGWGSRLEGFLDVGKADATIEGEGIRTVITMKVVKDIPEFFTPEDNPELLSYAWYSITLFDKDMAEIGTMQKHHEIVSILNRKKGEAITLSGIINTDGVAAEIVKDVKYVRITIKTLNSY